MREFLKLVKVPNFLLSMASEVKVIVHLEVDSFFMNKSAKVIFF